VLERRSGLHYPVPLFGSSKSIDSEIHHADVVLIHDGAYLPCVLAQRVARRAPQARRDYPAHRSRAISQSAAAPGDGDAESRVDVTSFGECGTVVFISGLTLRHFAAVAFRRPPLLLFNGVDSTLFTPPHCNPDGRARRRSSDLDPERPTILFVGRFVEKKGLNHLEQMARLRPGWDWVLAGWGPIDPAKWRLPNMRVFADRSGTRLAPLRSAADALVLPSVGEGYPLVIREALACGLPVVCADDIAIADPAAQPFLTGVSVLTDNSAVTAGGFVDALDAIVASDVPAEAGRLARADFARMRYSWAGMAEELLVTFTAIQRDITL
jgi:glycosyltransferase involved in cell wall biosynthesis